MITREKNPRALPDPVESPTLSIGEAAAVLGVSAGTLYEAVRRGDFPAVRVRRRIVVSTAALVDLLSGVSPAIMESSGVKSAKFSEWTMDSGRMHTIAAVTSSAALISVGYERRTIDEFVELLVEHAVDILVDVRLNAISRKRGFSKTALSTALASAGIAYRHERELGNPKDNREPFRQGLATARERYSAHLSNGASGSYDEVIALAANSRVALLCFERNHDECHRSCITDAALENNPSMLLEKI